MVGLERVDPAAADDKDRVSAGRGDGGGEVGGGEGLGTFFLSLSSFSPAAPRWAPLLHFPRSSATTNDAPPLPALQRSVVTMLPNNGRSVVPEVGAIVTARVRALGGKLEGGTSRLKSCLLAYGFKVGVRLLLNWDAAEIETPPLPPSPSILCTQVTKVRPGLLPAPRRPVLLRAAPGPASRTRGRRLGASASRAPLRSSAEAFGGAARIPPSSSFFP